MKFQNFVVKNKMAAEDKLREEAARRIERRRKEGRLTFTSHFFCSQSVDDYVSLQLDSDPGGCPTFIRRIVFIIPSGFLRF
jgi:hypothetical protein